MFKQLQQHWKGLLSIALSVLILFVFIQDANKKQLWTLLGSIQWSWLIAALVLKSVSLTIHEYRLWLGFAHPRPPLQQTMQIGFASALLNIAFPGRAGDIAAIAMLHKRCGVPVGIATFAVGMVGFFEGAIFGLMMLSVLLFNASMWVQYLGQDLHIQSVQTISGLTLLGIGIVVFAALIGRRMTSEPPTHPTQTDDFSPVEWLKDAFNQTGSTLVNLRYIALNALASFAEVWLMITAFAMGFGMLGLSSNTVALTPLMMWSLSGLVLGISAIASIVLPPTYGASSAAASIFILGLFGFDQTQSLGFATTWWLISQVPTVVLGLPCLWTINLGGNNLRQNNLGKNNVLEAPSENRLYSQDESSKR